MWVGRDLWRALSKPKEKPEDERVGHRTGTAVRYAAIERRVLVRDDVGGIGKRGHMRGFCCAGGFGLDPLDHGESRKILRGTVL